MQPSSTKINRKLINALKRERLLAQNEIQKNYDVFQFEKKLFSQKNSSRKNYRMREKSNNRQRVIEDDKIVDKNNQNINFESSKSNELGDVGSTPLDNDYTNTFSQKMSNTNENKLEIISQEN